MLSLTGTGRSLGNGLGQTFTGFKCSSTICYGTDGGATHSYFKEIQYQMNRIGRTTFSGWKAIPVDGFIGKDTLAAWKTLASQVPWMAAWSVPGSFVELAQTLAGDKTGFSAAFTEWGDLKTGTAELPAKVDARVSAAAQEGIRRLEEELRTPVTVPIQPVTTKPGAPAAVSTTAPTTAPRGRARLGVVVGVTAGLAAIGLVGIAVLQKKKRR